MESNLIFNLQRGIFLHSLEETLLSAGGERKGEVAVGRLRKGGPRHTPFPDHGDKRGLDAEKQTEEFHGRTRPNGETDP